MARERLDSLVGLSLIMRRIEEDEERGWSSGGDKHVCGEHVEDHVLAKLIAENASLTPCTYCGGEGGAPIDVLIERIASSLHGWEEFAETVRHHRRDSFSDHDFDGKDPDCMAPGTLFAAIGDALRSGGLVRPLQGEPIYRAS